MRGLLFMSLSFVGNTFKITDERQAVIAVCKFPELGSMPGCLRLVTWIEKGAVVVWGPKEGPYFRELPT